MYLQADALLIGPIAAKIEQLSLLADVGGGAFPLD